MFADGTSCFMGSECDNNFVHSGMVVADLNGDGMDDVSIMVQTLLLSNNSKLYDQSNTSTLGIDTCDVSLLYT